MALTQKWVTPVVVTAAKLNTDSIPVVSSPSDISGGFGPYVGQIIFNTTDNMLYRYDGSSWVAFCATGGNTAATRHEIRYEQKTGQAQSIPNVTDTKVQFPTVVTTSNDVTVSGTGNTDYTVQRAGVWLITASIRFVAGSTGERHLFLSAATNRVAGDSSGNVGTAPISLSVATVMRLASGDNVYAGCYQSNGGALSTDVGFGSSNHISLTWLRPL